MEMYVCFILNYILNISVKKQIQQIEMKFSTVQYISK